MRGPKFPIIQEQIDDLVAALCAGAMTHLVHGQIMLKAMETNSDSREKQNAKISTFRRNATGFDQNFSGNLSLKHLYNLEIASAQFGDWLEIFRKTKEDVLLQ